MFRRITGACKICLAQDKKELVSKAKPGSWHRLLLVPTFKSPANCTLHEVAAFDRWGLVTSTGGENAAPKISIFLKGHSRSEASHYQTTDNKNTKTTRGQKQQATKNKQTSNKTNNKQ
jgi:hypothetical protein